MSEGRQGWGRVGGVWDTGAVQIHPESFLMGMKIIPNTAGGISLYRDSSFSAEMFSESAQSATAEEKLN